MKNVLFIAAHRLDRSPGQRYRFEQYLPFLKEQGYACTLSHLINAQDDAAFYANGKAHRKAWILAKSVIKRSVDLMRLKQYDLIFIQREALMVGSTFFERKMAQSKAKVIFDFDDSIWLMDTSVGNKRFEWLKDPLKTKRNISYADLVFAGNEYLASYAQQFNPHVWVVPTTIDTDVHKPNWQLRNNPEYVTIGWSGSETTIKHFENAMPALLQIKERYGNKVRFTVMGDASYRNPALGIVGLPWSSQQEVPTLNTFDIGIMPLPNDEWAKGKCGLKGLSYMALEIPTIMSPVGVNSQIIQHGVNGFLADTTEEWVHQLSQLIDSKLLRQQIGEQARQTVEDKYSVNAQKHTYLKAFDQLTNRQ